MKVFSQFRGTHGGKNKFKQAPNATLVQQRLLGSGNSDEPSGEITSFNYEWNGDTTGKKMLSVMDILKFYHISSDIISRDNLLGASIKTYFDYSTIEGEISQDGEITVVETSSGNLIVLHSDPLPLAFIAKNIGYDSFLEVPFEVTTTGVWFLGGDNALEYTHYLRKDITI